MRKNKKKVSGKNSRGKHEVIIELSSDELISRLLDPGFEYREPDSEFIKKVIRTNNKQTKKNDQ